jgi:regulator of cell morphogenesis and NO signaling
MTCVIGTVAACIVTFRAGGISMNRSHLDTTPLGDIVAHDFRASAIFDRYGFDYCCGGRRSLAEACRQRGVDVEEVVSEIEELDPAHREPTLDDAAALVDYIVTRHHTYVRMSLPLIQQHLEKVVARHGEGHPELRDIADQFGKVADELRQHMVKEEQVLFPYIQALANAVERKGSLPPDIFGTVQNPIRMMEMEHQEAGDGLEALRTLSQGYEAPPDACTTYRLVFKELAAFEEDLHQHVHLENNVLFPRAVELESRAEALQRGLKSDRWR